MCQDTCPALGLSRCAYSVVLDVVFPLRQDKLLTIAFFFMFRMDYLKNANLFAEDVKKEHAMEERAKFKETLKFQRKEQAGADLGLW